MRLNKFVALATGMSRRAADTAIAEGRVTVDGQVPSQGQQVTETDNIELNGSVIQAPAAKLILLMNKPSGYVVSRLGQGSRTVYDLLPDQFASLKPVGRLDKDTSGLLLLTNDGDLANDLTHPKYQKQKTYEAVLNKPLLPLDKQALEQGVPVEDYISSLQLSGTGANWTINLHQGKNRQIRKSFAARGYKVIKLHRTHFAEFELGGLQSGTYRIAS